MPNEGITLPPIIKVKDIPAILCSAIADATDKDFPCFCGENPITRMANSTLDGKDRETLRNIIESITSRKQTFTR